MSRFKPLSEFAPSAEVAALQPIREDLDGPRKAYNINLKARPQSLPMLHAPSTPRPDTHGCAAPLQHEPQMRGRRVHAAAPAVGARHMSARLPATLTRAAPFLRLRGARRRLFTRR